MSRCLRSTAARNDRGLIRTDKSIQQPLAKEHLRLEEQYYEEAKNKTQLRTSCNGLQTPQLGLGVREARNRVFPNRNLLVDHGDRRYKASDKVSQPLRYNSGSICGASIDSNSSMSLLVGSCEFHNDSDESDEDYHHDTKYVRRYSVPSLAQRERPIATHSMVEILGQDEMKSKPSNKRDSSIHHASINCPAKDDGNDGVRAQATHGGCLGKHKKKAALVSCRTSHHNKGCVPSSQDVDDRSFHTNSSSRDSISTPHSHSVTTRVLPRRRCRITQGICELEKDSHHGPEHTHTCKRIKRSQPNDNHEIRSFTVPARKYPESSLLDPSTCNKRTSPHQPQQQGFKPSSLFSSSDGDKVRVPTEVARIIPDHDYSLSSSENASSDIGLPEASENHRDTLDENYKSSDDGDNNSVEGPLQEKNIQTTLPVADDNDQDPWTDIMAPTHMLQDLVQPYIRDSLSSSPRPPTDKKHHHPSHDLEFIFLQTFLQTWADVVKQQFQQSKHRLVSCMLHDAIQSSHNNNQLEQSRNAPLDQLRKLLHHLQHILQQPQQEGQFITMQHGCQQQTATSRFLYALDEWEQQQQEQQKQQQNN